MSRASKKHKIVSLIIPVLNEEDAISPFMAALDGCLAGISGYHFEYIFVDDGSTDGTLARLRNLAEAGMPVRITALNFNLSRLIGPVIGGFLIQGVGAPHAFAITAATYVAPVTAIFFMRPRERSAPTSAAGDGYLGELLDGWRYALARHHVRAAIVFAGIGALAGTECS